MARYTPPGSLNSILAINAELEKISEAFEDTVSRKNDSPNQLEGDLDLNGNSLLNVQSSPDKPNSVVFRKEVYTKEETDALLEENREYTDEREANIRADFSEGITGATVVVYPDVASLEASEPTQTGQRAEVVERANVQYTVADPSYIPTAADVTAANGRVWKLVHNGVIYSEWFGSDYDALNTCIQYAGLFGAKVYTSTDVDFEGSTLSIPSGVEIIGVGKPSWTNAKVVVEGQILEDVALTSEALPGDQVLSLSSTSNINVDDTLRLVSTLNANSSDAEGLQLGDRTSDRSTLGEFVEVESVSGNTVTLKSQILWKYPTTDYPDTPVGLSTSKAVRVDLNTDTVLSGVNISGDYEEYLVVPYLCKNLQIKDCIVTASDWGCVKFTYCYNSKIKGGVVTQTLYESSVGAENIPLKFTSCQECEASGGLEVYGGYQGIDITYDVGNTDLFGGPSIACVIDNTLTKGSSVDGITSHPGTFASRFTNNTVYGGDAYGIRTRGIQDIVTNNTVFGRGVTGTGIGLTEAMNRGALIANNIVYNCRNAFAQSVQPLFDYSKQAVIRDNISQGCSYGLSTSYDPHSIKIGTIVKNNVWIGTPENPLIRGITLGTYSNGYELIGNRSYHAVEAGIRYFTNTVDLTIEDNKAFDLGASAYGVRGPSVSQFITDTATFPNGEADANLSIRNNERTGGLLAYASIIANPVCYRVAEENGYQPFVASLADVNIDVNNKQTFSLYLDNNASPPELRAKVNNGSSVFDVLISQLT